jgi:NIMA (never in mitosis gene a)-related kinase 1/4/5
MSLSEFHILGKLGQGAYSIVYKARRHSDNKLYAIKKVKIKKLSDKEKANALCEIRIMASIKHPNVISYKEAFFDEREESLCLIMEYADSGDLWQKLQKCIKRCTKLSEKSIWSIFVQLTRGLKALHDLGVFHRDLKSANVFLNRDGTVKLGDMNVSKVSDDGFLATQTGTPYYASPEVWKDMKYNNKSDIWSLGCVLYEAITLKPPFRATDMEGLFEKVIEGQYDPIPSSYSQDLNEILKKILNIDAELRPSCDEILKYEFVSKHYSHKVLNSSTSSLINPINLPIEINLLSQSLPRPDYGGFDSLHSLDKAGGSTRLPPLNSIHIASKKYGDLCRSIENPSDRLKRIREIYLSPKNLLLSPYSRVNKKTLNYKK